MQIRRFMIVMVNLDPVVGSEISKVRPALVLSPDELNRHLNTVIVAPITRADKGYLSRYKLNQLDVDGFVALDQIRTIDKERVVRIICKIREENEQPICALLTELFSY
jgi:mRNA interferase MazF